jgi:hypothetical protein
LQRCIADTGGKFAAGVTVDLGKDVTTCVKEKTPAVNLPLVSVTPVVNLLPVSTKLAVHLELQIFW